MEQQKPHSYCFESKKCHECVYHCSSDKKDMHCQYFLITGKRRNCPGGEYCTKFKEGKPVRQKDYADYNNYGKGYLNYVYDFAD